MAGADHKVNHAVYSPDGTRFVFMHRWLGGSGKFSRLYVARMPTVRACGCCSTIAWCRTTPGATNTGCSSRRARRTQGDRYYLLDVSTGTRQAYGAGTLDRFGDGHPSFSPDGRWIVTDTYPDRARMRACCCATSAMAA